MDSHDRKGGNQSLYDKLAAEVSVASWNALKSHADRGALFWVDRQLDLVEVAVSIALDDVAHDILTCDMRRNLHLDCVVN